MCLREHVYHLLITIPLADREDPVIVPSDKKTIKAIKELLRELDKHQNCPACGGLVPELGFTYKGKEYSFTCHSIEEKGKVIAQTDYERFAKYCEARTKG